MTFLLLLILHTIHGAVSIQTAGPFYDLPACKAAGEAARARLEPKICIDSFGCTWDADRPIKVEVQCAAQSSATATTDPSGSE